MTTEISGNENLTNVLGKTGFILLYIQICTAPKRNLGILWLGLEAGFTGMTQKQSNSHFSRRAHHFYARQVCWNEKGMIIVFVFRQSKCCALWIRFRRKNCKPTLLLRRITAPAGKCMGKSTSKMKFGELFLRHYNAPAHSTLSMGEFLAKNNVTVVQTLPNHQN